MLGMVDRKKTYLTNSDSRDDTREKKFVQSNLIVVSRCEA